MPPSDPRIEDSPALAPAAADPSVWTRSTAPQTPFTREQVLVGVLILILGLLLTVAYPIFAA